MATEQELSQIKIPKHLRDELQEAYPNTSPTRILTGLAEMAISGLIDMSFLFKPKKPKLEDK